MSRISTFIFILLQVLLVSTSLHSQSSICLDFEDLKPGDRFGKSSMLAAGDLFYSTDEISTTLLPFSYLNGTEGFEDVLIYNDSVFDSQLSGTYLFPSNINLSFDFSNVPFDVQSVCMDFRYWGGEVNIGANDSDLLVVGTYDEFLALDGKEIADGVFVKIRALSTTNRAGGVICFTGDIKSITIGGQEFSIDNLCAYFEEPFPDCQIYNLVAEPHPCTPNNIFFADVDFEVEGETSGSYTVIVNNQIFGPFRHDADSFLTVGPIIPYGDEEFFVTVFDSELNECKANTSFKQTCSNDCNIKDVKIVLDLCSDDLDAFDDLIIDFETEFPISSAGKFHLNVGDIDLGEFDLASVPLRLPVIRDDLLKGDEIPFKLCFRPVPGADECCIEGIIIIKRCPEECVIENFRARVVDCDESNGTYFAELKFEAENTGTEGFNVFAFDGQSFGPFRYSNVPVTVGPFKRTNAGLGLLVSDNEFASCADTLWLENLGCEPKCDIEDLKVEIVQCRPNGNYDLLVHVDFSATWRDYPFLIYVDGNLIGEYKSGSVPILLEDVPVYSRALQFEVKVCPLDASGTNSDYCCKSFSVDKRNCPSNCPIAEIKAEITHCYPNGNFDIYLDARFTDDNGIPFGVYIDGEFLGFYEAEDLPLQLENVNVPTDATTFEVQVCPIYFEGTDPWTNECCERFTLKKTECPPFCFIDGVRGKVVNCYDDGSYDIAVDVHFSVDSIPVPFTVLVDGQTVGSFPADTEFPLLLEQIPVFTDALDFNLQICPISITAGGPINERCCVDTQVAKEPCNPGSEDCLSFDDLAQNSYGGDQNPPGTEIFNIDGVSFRLLALQNYDWTTSYEKLAVVSADNFNGFPAASGNVLVNNNISTIISFAGYDNPVEKVTVDYFNTGTHINLAANGNQIQILSILTTGFYTLAPGVEVEIRMASNDGSTGSMIFYGNIQSLLIGGNELALDNLCINEPEDCKIGRLVLEPTECDANGSFYLELDFEHENTSDHFVVEENGVAFARFAYDELPVKLGPFQTPYEAGSIFRVYDAFHTDCSSRTEFGPYFCEQKCEITGVEVYDIECDPNNGVYHMTIEVKGENLGDIITVQTKSGFVYRYQYTGRPERISNVPLTSGGYYDGVTVCAGIQPNDATNCCYEVQYDVPCKAPCQLEDAKVYDFECEAEKGVYHLTLEVKGKYVGQVLYVSTESGFFKVFEYNGGPVRISNIPLTDAYADAMSICGVPLPADGFECCIDIKYEVNCRLDCKIENIEAFDFDCYGNDYYGVSFKIDSPYPYGVYKFKTGSGLTQRVWVDSNYVRIDSIPLPATGVAYDSFVFCKLGTNDDGTINDQTDCCFEGRYEIPCVGPCPQFEVSVFDIECQGPDSTYSMSIKLGGLPDNFDDILYLRTKSGYEARFKWEGEVIRLEGIPNFYWGEDGLQICAANNPDCCVEAIYEIPCQGPCPQFEVRVFDLECDRPDTTYSISIKLAGLPDNYDGILYLKTKSGYETRFKWEGEAIRLEGIPNFYWGEDGLQICAANARDCCVETSYEVPCQDACPQFEVRVFDLECDGPDSTYSLSIKLGGLPDNFDDIFHLRTKSGYEARFKWEGEAIRLEGIPNFYWGEDALQICAANHPNCCVETSYEVPCQMLECKIGELKAEATPCASDGSFYVELNFRHENTRGGFEVFIGGRSFGLYSYGSLPVRVGPIYPGIAPVERYNVTVKDISGNCQASTVVEACKPEACSFTNLVLEPTECEDGKFYVEFEVDIINPQSNGYLVFAEGELFGPFQYGSRERKILGPFYGDGVRTYDFLFVDLGDPTCYTYEEIGPFDCEQDDCKITEITAEALHCNDDGSYRVFIDFWHENAGNEYFDIFTNNGDILGTYRLDQLPLEADIKFPNDSKEQKLIVCINDKEIDCCIRTELVLPPCEPCEGIGFKAIPTTCDSAGQFNIDLSFDLDLTVIYPVVIEINGELYDTVEIANPEFAIGPFAAGKEYTIKVIDLFRPGCERKLDLGVVDCQNNCGLGDVKVDAFGCNPDGTYNIYLDIDYFADPDSNSVLHLIDYEGNIVEEFTFAELPLEIKGVKLSADTPYLSVCVAGTDCCVKAFVPIPECIPCNIQRAEVAYIECIDSAEFFIGIRADWDISMLEQFMVVEGDIAYPIELSDDGIAEVGPFINRPDSIFIELQILDLQNPDCKVKLEFLPIPCEEDDDEVWPGDANLDNIANHLDLLNLGIAWGIQGPSRPTDNVLWSATPSASWGERFTTGLDFKHADCDGDGVVDENDVKVILANYGRTHGEVLDAIELPSTDFDPPVFFDIPEEDLPDSSFFSIPIILGSEDQPLKDIYGVAFTIEFDPEVIDPEAVEIHYPASWLGEKDVNLATIDYTYVSDGVIEVALTRTDQNEVSGYGMVAYFKGIRDDILGRAEAEMEIKRSVAIRNNNDIINLRGVSSTMKFKAPEPPTQRYGMIDLKRGMRVYPNPATDIVQFENLFGVPIDGLQVLSTDGKVMTSMITDTNQLDVSNLPEGLYIIRIDIGGYNIHHKLFKKK